MSNDIQNARKITPSFRVKIGKAYYSNGFFNVSVDNEKLFGAHDSNIEVELGNGGESCTAYVNRTANRNQTPRIMCGLTYKDWVQNCARIGDYLCVEVHSKSRISLSISSEK